MVNDWTRGEKMVFERSFSRYFLFHAAFLLKNHLLTTMPYKLYKKTMGSKRLLLPIEPFLFIFGSAVLEDPQLLQLQKLDVLYNHG